jgi:ATP-dependent DNA ligase
VSLPNHYSVQAAVGGDEASAEPFFGVRMILHKDMRGRVRLYSRRISKKTGEPADNTAQLQHIADAAKALPNGTVLDGEVVAPGETSISNLVTKVTGSLPARAKEVQEKDGYLIFKAFDVLAFKGIDLTIEPFIMRQSFINDMLVDLECIEAVPWYTSERMKRKLYAEVCERGGEGLIFKRYDAPYHQGKRDKSWVKLKREKTWDVVFLGIELAKAETIKKGEEEATASRIAGKAGAIKFGQYALRPTKTDTFIFAIEHKTEPVKLTEFGTCSGFDDAMRDDITENASVYIGRVFEIKAQQRFDSGSFRHPRFLRWRDDKQAAECIFRQNEG